MDEISDAWTIVSRYLDPRLQVEENIISEEFKIAVEKLKARKLEQLTKEWFIERYQKILRNHIVPGFWKYFQSSNEENDQSKLYNFKDAVNFLHLQIKTLSVFVNRLNYIIDIVPSDQNVGSDLKLLLKAILLSQLPLNYEKCIQCFYNRAFKVYQARQKAEDDEVDIGAVECHGCGFDPESCQCSQIWELFVTVNQQLYNLGLLEKLAGDTATFITHSLIDNHVKRVCKGNFEEAYLEILQEWLERVVLRWLHHIYHGNADSDSANKDDVLQNFKNRLSHFLWEIYAKMRIDELFSIIVEYPESQPAIEDLRDSLEKTNLRSNLIQTLKTAFEKRLLHPGVATIDIISAYVSTIKALRVLDSTGVILQLVCEPLRKYLKTREDTVKWIVYNLTVDSNNELCDELVKGEPLLLDELYHSCEELENWESWQPDPVDADPTKTSQSRKSSDIISTLVNIYGSKELFVREYRTLLADRILLRHHHDTQKEIRYLELLKLRFGETELHLPEVMLKDVIDSRRINLHIQSEKEKDGNLAQADFHVSALVLSARFWPSFREDKLELPPQIQEAFVDYTKSYETLKGNRTLTWKPHLGLVSLEIESNDKVFSFSVSPVHASIIMNFEKKPKWTIEELSSVMKTSTSMLRRKITFWQTQGLIKEESKDTFVLLKDPKLNAAGHVFLPSEDDDDETESAMASSHDQREEVLQVFWSYIVGMLTNLESLPLDRIHSMLKMFAVQGPTSVECSIEELKQFLDRKVREQKLTIFGDQYKLPKST